MVLLKGLKEGSSKQPWVEAMSMACDIGNICATTANEGGMSPFEMWHGIPPTPSGIQPFGMVGYVAATARKYKLKPRGVGSSR